MHTSHYKRWSVWHKVRGIIAGPFRIKRDAERALEELLRFHNREDIEIIQGLTGRYGKP